MDVDVKIVYTDEPEHAVVVSKSSLTGVNQIINLFANDFNLKHGNVRVLDERLLKLEKKDSLGNTHPFSDEDLQSIGDTIYVSNFLPLDVLFTCGNFGCTKEYYEKDNHDTACQFHVKNVVFHEGLKGWGCCKKRVTDFDQCLAIEGCAIGRHKPAEKKLAKAKESIADNMVVAKSGDMEHYTDLKAAPRQPIPTVNKPEKKAEKPKERVWEADTPDPADSVIAVGTPCTHNGCKASFQDDSSRTETCHYHPGEAEFHEGSKGWICCKPRMLEFSEFLKIPGCFEGKHKFIPDTSKIKIKHDFYQSGNNVYVTFYSKNVKKADSTIKFSPNMIHVTITLANGTPYNEDLFLAKTIIPEQCKYEILSTKISVTLFLQHPQPFNPS